MMKIIAIVLFILLVLHTAVFSNPVDSTPVVKFSELIFDSNNNWTMEIFFPYGNTNIDSVVFCIGGQNAKLACSYPKTFNELVAVITSDSLTNPLFINHYGDKISIFTYGSYWHDPTSKLTRSDSIIFGNYNNATVGLPDTGYSIYRVFWYYSSNMISVDFLNNNPDFGSVNDSTGFGAILKGNIYDANNKLVKNLKPVGYGDIPYFILQTPLLIDTNGAYITQIFPIACSPAKLTVRLMEFMGPLYFVDIEPFELKDIRPKTVFIHDIHLRDNQFVDGVNSKILFPNDELKLINYPNPFNLSTNFFIKIPVRLQSKSAQIDVYNLIGQHIRSIILSNGKSVSWDGKNATGKTMSSGIYYYTLRLDNHLIKTGSMVLLK